MKAKRNEWALALLAAAAAMSLPGAVHAHGAPMNPAPVELGER